MCDHAHTVVNTTGYQYYDGMEIVDTLETHLICVDCGEELDQDMIPIPVELPLPIFDEIEF